MSMLQSQTAVLEKNTTWQGDFATEPFEVAWAREARWFFQIIDSTGDPTVTLYTQISPDGLSWVDLPASERTIAGDVLTSWPVAEFGHWLRIRGTVDRDASVKVRVYLALKS